MQNASELLEHVALLHAVQRLLAAHDPAYVLPDDARLSSPRSGADAAAGLSLSFGTRTRASSSVSAASPGGSIALTSIEVAPVDAALGGAPSRRLSADGSTTVAPPANTPASALTPHAAAAAGAGGKSIAAAPPTVAAVLCGSGAVWWALLWCVLSGYYTSSLQPTLPLYVSDRWSASTAVIGLLFVVLAAGFAAGSPLAAALTDRVGRYASMALGLGGVCVTYCLFGRVESLEAEFGTAFFFGFAQSLALSPCLPLFAEAWALATGSLPFARVFAWFNAFHLFGVTAGAIVQPHIASAAGFDDALLLSATGVAAVWLALVVASCVRQKLN